MTTSFAELGLNEQILAGVESLGFTQPTPVQEQAIPLVLEGRDIVASAQTGTGKTAAFALPTLQLIMGLSADVADDAQVVAADVPTPAEEASPAEEEAPKPQRHRRRRRRGKGNDRSSAPVATGEPARPLALVVTPTRELAQQIERVVTTVCEHTGQRSVIVMGGAKFDRQLKALARGCDLLVATPGRLIDLMEHRHVDLSQVRVLVLDEADRMLDMGFWPSVRRIVAALPTKRQNLLFSATIPPSIKGTIDAMLTDPATVEIARVGETADTVEEHLCPVTQGQKTQLLQAIVSSGGAEPGAQLERVLVFCRTKHRVDDVSKTLKSAGLKVEVMHADRPQKARDKALERFRAGEVQLLVATDVMSRGIDVSGIDAVVNFDVPMDPEDYVHRIGRTGRAGATGHAYTFVAPDEITPLREIEYFTKKLVPVWDLPGFAYDSGRIVPNPNRATTRTTRTMFSGSKSRRGFGGPSSGRFGRHY
jgi:ATP-dependent RNA helicase RhlE